MPVFCGAAVVGAGVVVGAAVVVGAGVVVGTAVVGAGVVVGAAVVVGASVVGAGSVMFAVLPPESSSFMHPHTDTAIISMKNNDISLIFIVSLISMHARKIGYARYNISYGTDNKTIAKIGKQGVEKGGARRNLRPTPAFQLRRCPFSDLSYAIVSARIPRS